MTRLCRRMTLPQLPAGTSAWRRECNASRLPRAGGPSGRHQSRLLARIPGRQARRAVHERSLLWMNLVHRQDHALRADSEPDQWLLARTYTTSSCATMSFWWPRSGPRPPAVEVGRVTHAVGGAADSGPLRVDQQAVQVRSHRAMAFEVEAQVAPNQAMAYRPSGGISLSSSFVCY